MPTLGEKHKLSIISFNATYWWVNHPEAIKIINIRPIFVPYRHTKNNMSQFKSSTPAGKKNTVKLTMFKYLSSLPNTTFIPNKCPIVRICWNCTVLSILRDDENVFIKKNCTYFNWKYKFIATQRKIPLFVFIFYYSTCHWYIEFWLSW